MTRLKFIIAATTMYSSLFMSGLCISQNAYALKAIGEARVVQCPKPYQGDVTIVQTDDHVQSWHPLKWTCKDEKGTPLEYVLKAEINKAPPLPTDPVRYDGKCPSNTVGTVRFVRHNGVTNIEDWTCSASGTARMDLTALKKALTTNVPTIQSSTTSTRSCKSPFKGQYTVKLENKKWALQAWDCVNSKTNVKAEESIMQSFIQEDNRTMLIP